MNEIKTAIENLVHEAHNAVGYVGSANYRERIAEAHAMIQEAYGKVIEALTASSDSEQERDWTEDFQHENGDYFCRCTTCGNTFRGYKRRVTCKACASHAAKVEQEPVSVVLPERVIDTLWQAAGLSTYHPDGDQLEKFHDFAHGVTAEVLARLPKSAPQAQQEAWKDEPDQALLISMACCLNHGFGLESKERQERYLHDMRKVYDEVIGRGYYKPENREGYLALLNDEDHKSPSDTLREFFEASPQAEAQQSKGESE